MFTLQERLGLNTEAIEGALYQWACMMRTAIPGIVKSFDPVKQVCSVDVAIREFVLVPPPSSIQSPTIGTTQNIPVSTPIKTLEDVIPIMMRVSGWSITLPITPGTECLLIFADTCVDGWWLNGGQQACWDRRRHDLSDAFALFGPWSQPNKLSNYSTSTIQIRSDDQNTMIEIESGTVRIKTLSQVMLDTPNVIATENLRVDNGATGSFSTPTGETVTVQDGIITNIY